MGLYTCNGFTSRRISVWYTKNHLQSHRLVHILITTCGELPSGFSCTGSPCLTMCSFIYAPDGDLLTTWGTQGFLGEVYCMSDLDCCYRLVDSSIFLVIDQRLTYCHREKNEKPLGHREFFDGSLGMPTKNTCFSFKWPINCARDATMRASWIAHFHLVAEKGGQYDWGIPAFLPAHSLLI